MIAQLPLRTFLSCVINAYGPGILFLSARRQPTITLKNVLLPFSHIGKQKLFLCYFRQIQSCHRLICLFKISISFSYQYGIHLALLFQDCVSHIIINQGVPFRAPGKLHRTNFTAQRLSAPGKLLKKTQCSLSGSKNLLFHLKQPASLIETDFQRCIHIAVICQTGGTEDPALLCHVLPGIRCCVYLLHLPVHIREKIIGYIAHCISCHHHPGIKIR